MRTSILLTAIVLMSAVGRAEDGANGGESPAISVVGVASAQIKPSVVEISATLSAEAEMANDARIKERDARQRVIDTLEAKVPGLTLEFKGISVNPVFDAGAVAMARQQQMMMQNGMVVQMQQNQAESRRYGVTEQVRLVLKDTDKLDKEKLVETIVRLIDTARESGLQIAQLNLLAANLYPAGQATPTAPLIICKASDSAAAREQGYKAAMEDARKKAAMLAELSGVKIGKVIGIQELDAGSGGPEVPQASLQGRDVELSSALLGELSLKVRLGVRFEIVK